VDQTSRLTSVAGVPQTVRSRTRGTTTEQPGSEVPGFARLGRRAGVERVPARETGRDRPESPEGLQGPVELGQDLFHLLLAQRGCRHQTQRDPSDL